MHYLTSRNHPVCDRCNVGFPSEREYAEVGGRVLVPAIYDERSEIVFRNTAQLRTTLRTAVQDLHAAVPDGGGIKSS